MAVECDGPGVDKRRRMSVVAIAGHAFGAVTRDGRNDTRSQVNAPHAAIVEVGEIDGLPALIESDAINPAEFRLCGWPAVT